MVFAEDANTTRTANAPRVLSALRNGAIGLTDTHKITQTMNWAANQVDRPSNSYTCPTITEQPCPLRLLVTYGPAHRGITALSCSWASKYINCTDQIARPYGFRETHTAMTQACHVLVGCSARASAHWLWQGLLEALETK